MRVLLQVVENAKVEVENTSVGHINYGLLLFVGFTDGDTHHLIDKMTEKLYKLRVFPDINGKTNLSIKDVNGQMLSVSQFTLYGDVAKSNRPSFTKALTPSISSEYFNYFNKVLEDKGITVQKGVFGADMEVTFTNKGPFTMLLDSEDLYGK